MSKWTEVRDGITNAVVNWWRGLPPNVRLGFLCSFWGFMLGFAFALIAFK